MTRGPTDPRASYEPNPALRLLYRRFFDHMQVDPGWVRSVRETAARGTVVYVLRSLNLVDFIALDHLTRRFDLPRIQYVNDRRFGVLSPSGRSLLDGLRGSAHISESQRLEQAIRAGGSAALFLKRPPRVIDVASGATHGRGLKEGDEHVMTLLQLQREGGREILLVPQIFVWTNRPDTQGAHPLDMLLGPREWPSSLRTAGQFLYNYRHVELRAGEPFSLASYLEGEHDCSDEVHVRRVIYAILRRLERERRTATGPARKSADRQRLQVLRSPKLQNTISHMAGERKEDQAALQQRAIKMLEAAQARPDSATIKALEVLLDRVFHRIYAGIEVDEEGVARLRELSKEGSLVLLPSHKSHVDYLVISYILNARNLQLPMIAAGDNLSFFPLGPILRRAGGFFIRRAFRGDRLYSSTIEAYVRRLLRDGFTLELFLEGGRSRTGKLLEPKFGLLSMIVDAALSLPTRQISFVPVSIGYERIVETGAYEHEMTGGEKQKEDAAGLLKSTEVLRHRYGRINLQFGSALTLSGMRDELGIGKDAELTPPRRRAVVTRLANRTMDEINRVTAVTPGALTALALLSDRRRGVSHEELMVRCQRLLGVLCSMGARVTPRVARDSRLREEAISEVAQMFIDGDLLEAHESDDGARAFERRALRTGAGVIYSVPDRKRVELDTAKNHIVHFFVERGLVALSVLYPPGPPSDEPSVRARVQSLSKLFKHEFRFRADASFDEIFEDTLDNMLAAGELCRDPRGLLPGDGHDGWPARVWLRTYAAIMRNFLEAYRVAARGLTLLLKGPMADKDLVKRSLGIGHRMYMAGDLELREAISKPLIQNALQAFREEGYLRQRDGKLSLTPSFDSSEAVNAIEGRLAGFLQARPGA
ncbi:MAG: 1-acyl-sn-glycerol-3-phosphate acyltransferase [Myxococcales bacterium]|nr:1-acyl-sn-glycerol-3-phosphate acyltransferase [Myxococcales bacterium]